jgi:hypothetical protein
MGAKETPPRFRLSSLLNPENGAIHFSEKSGFLRNARSFIPESRHHCENLKSKLLYRFFIHNIAVLCHNNHIEKNKFAFIL